MKSSIWLINWLIFKQIIPKVFVKEFIWAYITWVNYGDEK